MKAQFFDAETDLIQFFDEFRVVSYQITKI